MNCAYCGNETADTIGRTRRYNAGLAVYCNEYCRIKASRERAKIERVNKLIESESKKTKQMIDVKKIDWRLRESGEKKLHHNIDPRWTGKQIPYTAARGAGGMP